MRKLITVLLSVLLITATVSASRYSDVNDGSSYAMAIENLSNYGIISGYNGSFNPGGSITRAEAAKITAVTAGIDDEATAKSGIKKFSDVEIGNWSTGYINAVADSGYILGYPNGYYMPNNNITFAEMTTIVLRLLGYNSDVLGDNWPYAYMYKAKELGITDGVALGDYDIISRAQVCRIIDNALDEKIYGTDTFLSSRVSALKYSDPIVIRNTEPYAELLTLGINASNMDSYTVIRDGKAAKISDIMPFDVVYKAQGNNTLYVFCDKISGVYNEAFPSKADVKSVDISGNVLELETKTAMEKLGEKASSYKYNSRITVLLGKDGKIVDAVDINSAGNSGYGVLLSVSDTVSSDPLTKGEQKRYINILSGDGQEVSYETQKDYGDKIGLVGKISFDENGYANFRSLSNSVSLTGEIDKAKNKIGDTYLTSDATLIELVYEPSGNTGTAIAKVIDLEDITIDEIYKNNLVFALKTGDFGDVSFAVLKNVTNDSYSYGVLTDISSRSGEMSASATYTILSEGVSKTYSTSYIQSISKGIPVAMILENGALKSISPLKNSARGQLKAIDGLRVMVSGSVYETADNLQIYKYTAGQGYTSLSINQAKEYLGETAAVFTDSKAVSGGRARVVIIYY